MKTATKKLRREAKECRRELGGVLIVIARLEKRRVKLNITNPEVVFWLESLRERAKMLKSTPERIERLTEADIPCRE